MDGAHTQIWNECLEIFRDNLDEETFNTWFKPIIPVKYRNHTLLVQVPSLFFQEYLEAHFIELIRDVLTRIIGPKVQLLYRVVFPNDKTPKKNNNTITIPANKPINTENKETNIAIKKGKGVNPFLYPGIKKLKINSQLDKNYTFENLVEGSCNTIGIQIGKKAAEKPGVSQLTPLFIYGPSGVGKTHLANAIGLKAKEINPDLIVLNISAHDFQSQYTDAVRGKNVEDFINFYRNIDVLIVDDIQDFSGKDGTQKIFNNIFNYLHSHKKQLVFTADRPPVALDSFFDRLLTRFKWGIIIELETPDFETRKKILVHKAKLNGVVLTDRIIDIIASSIQTNVRELEGTLWSIMAHAMALGSNITVEIAQKVLKNITKERKPNYTIEEIIVIVAGYFKLQAKVLKMKTRKREVVTARQLAMYFAKKYTKKSLSEIGAAFNKDHSTVVHAIKTVKNLYETDKEFRIFLDDIERKLKY